MSNVIHIISFSGDEMASIAIEVVKCVKKGFENVYTSNSPGDSGFWMANGELTEEQIDEYVEKCIDGLEEDGQIKLDDETIIKLIEYKSF